MNRLSRESCWSLGTTPSLLTLFLVLALSSPSSLPAADELIPPDQLLHLHASSLDNIHSADITIEHWTSTGRFPFTSIAPGHPPLPIIRLQRERWIWDPSIPASRNSTYSIRSDRIGFVTNIFQIHGLDLWIRATGVPRTLFGPDGEITQADFNRAFRAVFNKTAEKTRYPEMQVTVNLHPSSTSTNRPLDRFNYLGRLWDSPNYSGQRVSLDETATSFPPLSLGQTTVDGHSCQVIRFSNPSPDRWLEVDLDPSIGAAVRRAVFRLSEKAEYQYLARDFRQYSDGVFLPQSRIEFHWRLNGNQRQLTDFHVSQLVRAAINSPIDPQEFHTGISEGTSFWVKRNDGFSDRYVWNEQSDAPILVETAPPTDWDEHSESDIDWLQRLANFIRPIRRPFAIFLAVVFSLRLIALLVFVGFVIYKRRSRHPQQPRSQ